MNSLIFREARPEDADLILEYIRELAEFERLSAECVADAALLRRFLFQDKRAQAILAEWDGAPAGFALYFYNFSTFLGGRGFIWRICSCGRHSAATASPKACSSLGAKSGGGRLRPLRMVGSRLERERHRLLSGAGRQADGRVDRAAPHRRGAAPFGG